MTEHLKSLLQFAMFAGLVFLSSTELMARDDIVPGDRIGASVKQAEHDPLAEGAAEMASNAVERDTQGMDASENKTGTDENAVAQAVPILVRVTGYGTYKGSEKGYSEAERLKAMRASKLDAYRNLAERIYGIQIAGQSRVEDFVLKNDDFGMTVNTYIRGARVVSVMENKNRTIETVLELSLPAGFQDCVNKLNSFRFSHQCFLPMPQASASFPKTRAAPNMMQQNYHLK